MIYKIGTYKKEHLRYAWLSGKYTDEQLKSEYYGQYKEYCASHNLECEN